MRIILLSLISLGVFGQKYAMPLNDTMDVIILNKNLVNEFKINVGEYSELNPIAINPSDAESYYFLPQRCISDMDMIDSLNFLDKERKGYLIISKKSFTDKNSYTFLREDYPINDSTLFK